MISHQKGISVYMWFKTTGFHMLRFVFEQESDHNSLQLARVKFFIENLNIRIITLLYRDIQPKTQLNQ